MELHTAFDLLSGIIERYERGGHAVRHVETTSDERGTLHATLELPVSLDPDDDTRAALSPETATMTDDGGFTVEFSTTAPALPADVVSAVSVDDSTVRVSEEGEVLLVVTLTLDPTSTDPPSTGDAESDADTESNADVVEDETRADGIGRTQEAAADRDANGTETDERVARLAAVRDDSLPPYEDTAYLRRLYDSCETFAEMSRLIEMDVAGETVRRYMIEAGIHTPTPYRTTRDGDDRSEATTDTDEAESEPEQPEREADDSEPDDEACASTGATTDAAGTLAATPDEKRATTPDEKRATTPDEELPATPDEELVADGIGLPDGLHIQDVVDAVAESSTVYEVQRELDLEQQHAWELLQQLGLLELLLGRISDGPRRAVSHETVTGRIRQRIANSA